MERGDFTMKKILTQVFFAAAVMICFSMTAAGQEDQKKQRPPKEKPPVIEPKIKDKPKDEKPKDEKSKKPEAMVFRFRTE